MSSVKLKARVLFVSGGEHMYYGITDTNYDEFFLILSFADGNVTWLKTGNVLDVYWSKDDS